MIFQMRKREATTPQLKRANYVRDHQALYILDDVKKADPFLSRCAINSHGGSIEPLTAERASGTSSRSASTEKDPRGSSLNPSTVAASAWQQVSNKEREKALEDLEWLDAFGKAIDAQSLKSNGSLYQLPKFAASSTTKVRNIFPSYN
jgi:hypothetical protein